MLRTNIKAQQFGVQIRKKQRQKIINQRRTMITSKQAYPLQSQLLSKYHNLPHQQIFKYIGQIQEYISAINLQILQQDTHDQLITDLFYLIYEFPNFSIKRGTKFLKNKSRLTASFVAMISIDIMPQQVSYWLPYMCDEDKDVVYLSIIGDKYHYLSWMMHPALKTYLMIDFKSLKSAVQAVKEIVGYRQYNLDKIITNKGQSIDDILVQKFTNFLQGMQKTFMCVEYLQIAVWVMKSRWNLQPTKDLFDLFNKIILSKTQMISDILLIWSIQAMNEGYMIMKKVTGHAIIEQLQKRDANSPTKLTKKQFQQFTNFLTQN